MSQTHRQEPSGSELPSRQGCPQNLRNPFTVARPLRGVKTCLHRFRRMPPYFLLMPNPPPLSYRNDARRTRPPHRDLLNPSRSALASDHSHMAMHNGRASKYPANVRPFCRISRRHHGSGARPASVARTRRSDLRHRRHSTDHASPEASLAAPSAFTSWFFRRMRPFLCLTKRLPRRPSPLSMPAMPRLWVDLITIAFPGYFRPRTCEMGRYYGVWDSTTPALRTRLIAMGGERQNFAGADGVWRELSGLPSSPKLVAGVSPHASCRSSSATTATKAPAPGYGCSPPIPAPSSSIATRASSTFAKCSSTRYARRNGDETECCWQTG